MVDATTGAPVLPDQDGNYWRWVPIEEYLDGRPVPPEIRRMWEFELAAAGRRRIRRSAARRVADDDFSPSAQRRRLWNRAVAASKSDDALHDAFYALANRWQNGEESGAAAQAEAQWEHYLRRKKQAESDRFREAYAAILPDQDTERGGSPLDSAEVRDALHSAAGGSPAELQAEAARHGLRAAPIRYRAEWPASDPALKNYFSTNERRTRARGAPRFRARAASSDLVRDDPRWPLEADPPLPDGYRTLTAREERRLRAWRRASVSAG